jgi:predicted CXXCH cytochrome family protein
MLTLRVTAALILALLFSLLAASTALAYDELSPSTGKTCVECHGAEEGSTSTTTVSPTRKGPHGGYTTGTQKCATCHSVHAAPSSILLLPAATIKDTCNSCHDGTGGKGVYGVVFARTGDSPGAQHRVETTSSIPGGDAATGGSREATFSAANGYMTCSDCHSPHDSNTVDAFVGDRYRASTGESLEGTPTNRLLKRRPTSAPQSWETTSYGSSWCGGCHLGRLENETIHNHPVETETAGFDYDNVVRVTGAETTSTELGTLGANNYGYVMPDPRSPLQDGKGPICQQCHEDGRSVGDDVLNYPQQISTSNGYDERWSVTTTDGANAPEASVPGTDNPGFQTFPHESWNSYLLIEENDDLCLNCHAPPP